MAYTERTWKRKKFLSTADQALEDSFKLALKMSNSINYQNFSFMLIARITGSVLEGRIRSYNWKNHPTSINILLDGNKQTTFPSLIELLAWLFRLGTEPRLVHWLLRFIQHGDSPDTVHDDTIAYLKELFGSRLLPHWSRVVQAQ